MGGYLVPKLMFNLVLPLSLLAAVLFRYNGLSLAYLVCLLFIPLIPSPSKFISRSAVKIQTFVLLLSLTFIISHIIFQMVMIKYSSSFERCSENAYIAEQVGFYMLNDCGPGNHDCKYLDIVRVFLPDVVVFLVSLVTLVTSKSLIKNTPDRPSQLNLHYGVSSHHDYLPEILPVFVGLMLLLGGIIQPSVFTSLYFLVFILLGLSWAFHLLDHFKKNTFFTVIKLVLTVYSGMHVVMLYLFQFPFMQDALQPDSFLPRLLGLPTIILASDCKKSIQIHLNIKYPWPFYVYPFTVFFLYWMLAVDIRMWNEVIQAESLSSKSKTPWWKFWNKDVSPLLENTPSSNYGTVEEPQQPIIQHEPSNVQGLFSSIMMFLMRQSYIAALIIMMAWSILYHSWLTFVLLLWACLTWITPFARRFCMVSSPYLVIYAELLLMLQYIYGMNLKDEELPVKKGSFEFAELGLTKSDYPVLHLGAQTLFTWIFLVTLRQYFREMKMARPSGEDTSSEGGEIVLTSITRPFVQAYRRARSKNTSKTNSHDMVDGIDRPSKDAKILMSTLKKMLAKYWILVCCAAFLLVALQNRVDLHQIFYMVIFLMGFLIYQFSARTWKTILRPLWWFMVIYSIVILLIIYTYQFDNMPATWHNSTHLSYTWLEDIGLRKQDKAGLLLELLIPTIFSIILVVQLHFFHKPLMNKLNKLLIYRKDAKRKKEGGEGNPHTLSTEVTSSTLGTTSASGGLSDDSDDDDMAPSVFKRMKRSYCSVTIVLWRFAEIHWPKFVCFVVALVAFQQVSAVNAFFTILVSIAMLNDMAQKFMNYIMIVWSSIVVLVFMIYQLHVVNEDILEYNCTAVIDNKTVLLPAGVDHFASNEYWLGFHKSAGVSDDVRGYLFIVLVIVFQKVIKHHQELYRYQHNLPSPPQGILFEDAERKNADENILGCLKYLCNHFFAYNGLEINLVVMVISICTRGDAVALLHSIWASIFLFARRRHVDKVWSIYVLYLAIFIPAQYILILGWPPGLCKDYPWTNAFGGKTADVLQWFYLTNQDQPQDQRLLIADFFQFLVACSQAKALKNASNQTEDSEEYVLQDFMTNKSWLDFIKILFLDNFIWLTLTIVYITAQTTTSIFNSGFIVGCFFFLWHGQGLYLRPRHTMVRWWKYFLAYTFFVVAAKVWLQLVSCVYISSIFSETNCFVIQLLNLYCIRPDVYDISAKISSDCVIENDPGLAMDTTCFIFALLQYGIFKSRYFKFVVREHRRQSEMANRGAQLVEERLQIHLSQSIATDKKKMQYIKNKVSRLKKKLAESNPSHQEPISHNEAIYSGDYYLFETSESESDSDDKVDMATATHDMTLSTPPQQTSEQVPAESPTVVPENVDNDGADASSFDSLSTSEEKDTSEASPDDIKIIAGGDTVDATAAEKLSSSSKTGLRKRRRKHKIRSDHTLDMETDATKEATGDDHQLADGDEERSGGYCEKLKELLVKANNSIKSAANSIIEYMDEISADYRHIAAQLQKERKERARVLAHSLLSTGGTIAKEAPSTSKSTSKSRLPKASLSHTITGEESETSSDTWSFVSTVEEEQEVSWKSNDSIAIRFLLSLYYALFANTDLICYFFMLVNHIYYASILSMPLPFFVFLWGMLSIPRPTKRFWVSVTTYVQLVIVIKYVFQFKFPGDDLNMENGMNFNECSYYKVEGPLCPPRIIGIERGYWSSVCDLLLLLCLFFHRFAMKSHGLWKEKSYSDEEDLSPKTPDASLMNSLEENVATAESIQEKDLTAASRNSQSPPQRSVCHNMRKFMKRMLDPAVGTGAVDVYAWMFASQFIIFIIILFSWSAFSSNEEIHSNFAKIIEQNVVPKTFLYMLLTQFLLIVVDRYMYMRKQILVKLVYQAALVLLLHIFLFIVVPSITKRPFTKNIPALFLYLFLCIYFGLSAYQVRCGYPTRILGNFLTKNYTVTSGILFQGIQAIPFLLELRSVLDWVCTRTTLSLNHWLKMEDIYANIFITKCWRDSEKQWPQSRGQAYSTISKWLVGGALVILLIIVIWFPLLLMSFISSAYVSNKPVEVTFSLTIGGYQPLFKVTTQQQFIKDVTDEDINKIVETRALTQKNWDVNKIKFLLSDYRKSGNLIRIKVLSNSSAIWTISPPSREFLIRDLESNNSLSVQFRYEFNREPNTTQAAIVQESVSGVTNRPLEPGDPIRMGLANVLRNPAGGGNISLHRLFPSFMSVPASGPVKPVEWLGEGTYVNCTILQRRGSAPFLNNSQVEWWEIIQESPKSIFSRGPGYLEIFALSDLVPPLHLSFLANTGIIGLYVGFVFVVGKFVRIFFTSISFRIMYDEMPNVDRILKLCLEVYMVRESKELRLEEDLFAKLLFLYRSPDTLIKWTKYKRFKTS